MNTPGAGGSVDIDLARGVVHQPEVGSAALCQRRIVRQVRDPGLFAEVVAVQVVEQVALGDDRDRRRALGRHQF